MCEVHSGHAGTKFLALGQVVVGGLLLLVARAPHEKVDARWTIGLEMYSISRGECRRMCVVHSGHAGTELLALGQVVVGGLLLLLVARVPHEKVDARWTIGLEVCSISRARLLFLRPNEFACCVCCVMVLYMVRSSSTGETVFMTGLNFLHPCPVTRLTRLD